MFMKLLEDEILALFYSLGDLIEKKCQKKNKVYVNDYKEYEKMQTPEGFSFACHSNAQ